MRSSLLIAVCATLSGCLGGLGYTSQGSLYRVRWDKNTWNAAALTIERFDHKPAETGHVRQFRWLHGVPPELPFPADDCLKPPKPEKHGLLKKH